VLHPPPMNWDDLRVIAAVREQGTYAGASARLRIDETTVARRVARIQRSLGATLFDAVDGIRKPTAYCEAVLAHIHEIGRHVAAIGGVGKEAHGLVGTFRIASTSLVAEMLLAPRAAQFLSANPGLTVKFVTSDENVNFSRWEADLAVRLRKPEKGDFAITKLANARFYFFEPVARGDAADEPIVCCYPEDLDHTLESRYLAAKRLQARGRCITANPRIVRALIKTGSAVGILAETLSAELLADRRLRATPVPGHREIWLLVQNHLKRDPAARVVIDWMRDCFSVLPGR
jgi:DNA-binding transcriptional LysR family regulator